MRTRGLLAQGRTRRTAELFEEVIDVGEPIGSPPDHIIQSPLGANLYYNGSWLVHVV